MQTARTAVDVLLLSIVPFVDGPAKQQSDVFAPIGAAYLAEMARSQGHTAAFMSVGVRDHAPTEVEAALARYTAQVIGLSATGNDLSILAKTVEATVRVSPQSYIVVGGYCSQRPDILCTIPGIDAVISGEGELSLVRLLHELKTQGRRKERAVRLIQGENIKSLDDLPLPTYINYPTQGRFIRVYASRGCPYRCSFCQIKGFFGTPTIRYHSKSYVDRLLRNLIAAHSGRAEIVLFNDDEFLLSPRHLVGMAAVMRELGLRMRFQTRVTDVLRHLDVISENRDVIDVIHLGVESFSDAQLKRWNKDATAANNRDAVEALSNIGVPYYPNIILTDASTNPSEIDETIKAILFLPPTGIWTATTSGQERASPLDIGLQLSRYKDFFGEAERKDCTKYLDALWRFIGDTKRHSDRLETAYVNSVARAEQAAQNLRRSIDELLRQRLIIISELAHRLATMASEKEQLALVSSLKKEFAQEAARVFFEVIDVRRVAALDAH